MWRLVIFVLLASYSSVRAATDTPCSCQGAGCTCKPLDDNGALQKNVSSVAAAPKSSILVPRGPAPKAAPPGGADVGSGLTNATDSLTSSLTTSQYSLPDNTLSNPDLELPDTAPAMSPGPAVAEDVPATDAPSPGPTAIINPATLSQYMVAGTTVFGNASTDQADLALVSQFVSMASSCYNRCSTYLERLYLCRSIKMGSFTRTLLMMDFWTAPSLKCIPSTIPAPQVAAECPARICPFMPVMRSTTLLTWFPARWPDTH